MRPAWRKDRPGRDPQTRRKGARRRRRCRSRSSCQSCDQPCRRCSRSSACRGSCQRTRERICSPCTSPSQRSCRKSASGLHVTSESRHQPRTQSAHTRVHCEKAVSRRNGAVTGPAHTTADDAVRIAVAEQRRATGKDHGDLGQAALLRSRRNRSHCAAGGGGAKGRERWPAWTRCGGPSLGPGLSTAVRRPERLLMVSKCIKSQRLKIMLLHARSSTQYYFSTGCRSISHPYSPSLLHLTGASEQ
jgi:hypothetical protein